MKTMKMNENMRNPDSDEFKQLSSSIENGLMSILIEEENLDKQMDFQVTVEDIKVDDSQVDFKILYNMKDSFLAVPFELKPVNMSDVLHKDFKLRKGILFENFPVDSDSLECSGSDPCADCSHKCGYDYSRQGYVCTCPAPSSWTQMRRGVSSLEMTGSKRQQQWMESLNPRIQQVLSLHLHPPLQHPQHRQHHVQELIVGVGGPQ